MELIFCFTMSTLLATAGFILLFIMLAVSKYHHASLKILRN